MDAWGDYIYIIAFIAIVVINILKRAKKQEAVSIPGPEFEEEMKEAGREYRELFPFPSIPKSPSVQTVAQPKKTVQPVTTEPKKKPLADVTVKEIPADDAFSISFKDTDDARKAFIYSEIWARKY